MEKLYLIIGLLTLISIGSFIILLKKMKEGIGQFNLKIYGITFVGILVAVLAISPVDSINLSPAYGILGGIAGYIFGLKDEKQDKLKDDKGTKEKTTNG